ncbi:Uncharacterised protein [Sphingobacterium spiritivorum]|uniref:Uncharacterized protein n=1 Tax=Sphingobacterium spiritivorum TaxID=258 RepID=A0A380BKR0_SPHSI|nr:hypothetical protein [Sphingobacterium spiritivorum]SUJ02419.1 Uncharacterised protein [Sphingobacterium spiritivorum]
MKTILGKLTRTGVIATLYYAAMSAQGFAQTNTFPASGPVGIGTTSPKAILDVAAPYIHNGRLGTVLGRLLEGDVTGEGTFLGVRGYGTQYSTQYGWKSFALEHSFYGYINSSINFLRGDDATGGFLTFNTDNNIERMRLDAKGKLLLGTTVSGGELLSVNGNIRAQEIKVEAANWPDYVFKPEYRLQSLTELESYIKQYGHLPGIPKAEIAEREGISLGEMNKVLLKKVEELTLHLIEKEKIQKQHEQQLADMVERLKKLEEK